METLIEQMKRLRVTEKPERQINIELSDEAQKFVDENFGPVDKETVDAWIEEAKDNPHIAVSIPSGYFDEGVNTA